MLALVRVLDHARYTPRVYVAAATDSHSIARALTQEQTFKGQEVCIYTPYVGHNSVTLCHVVQVTK